MVVWAIALAMAGVLVVVRIYSKLKNPTPGSRQLDWDTREIDRLRKAGYMPFKQYQVDFFLALPDEAACQAVRAQLESLGYSVDTKPMQNDTTLHFSLHACCNMRLIVPEMEEQSRRLTALAEQFQGRYDGWAAGPMVDLPFPSRPSRLKE
jgi:regulator of RNase E activity RraB